MGLSALRKIQIGTESVKGTAVAATAALLGTLSMKDTPTIHRPQEERGLLAPYHRSVKVGNMAELSFNGDATFEQILYWLHMGIEGSVTPTGAGAAKLWTFTPGLTAASTLNSFTLEYGDDVQAQEAEYCMAKSIEISGAMNDALKVKCDMFGRKLTNCSFTGALTPPTVESIPGQYCKVYIDDEDGTIGTTEVAAVLHGFNYRIKTGLVPARYGSGSLDFTEYAEGPKDIEVQMTLAFKSAVNTERANYDGETKRLVRIEAIGSLIEGSDYKELTLDACGVWTNWNSLGEQDGHDVVDVTLSGEYGSNYGKLFEVAVQSAVTSLP